MSRFKLGFDIGGTFTDFVLLDEIAGRVYVDKVLTTPNDPAVGVMEGLRRILRNAQTDGSAITISIHATTLITNALVERKGARTALLATEGFRDVLEMGTEVRYDIYDLFLERPEPLSPRDLRFDIRERLDKDGNVLVPLDEVQVRSIGAEMRRAGVQAVAVVFLHAFRNADHEQRVRRLLESELDGVSISISSDVAPEIREYERMSTTVANAYVQPITHHYVEDLEHRLADFGYSRRMFLMVSSGGITTGEIAKEYPIRLAESGPAAGVLAAAHACRTMGINNVISFDMGGTTAKIGLVLNNEPAKANTFEVGRIKRFIKGSGIPIKIPVIELIEIGAGGGSVAYIDRLGLLKVGPQSAGAEPGPACYGRGGTDPTVTDANVLLGYLDPGYFLGGAIALDVEAARTAINSGVATRLGLSVTEAARGIYRVVNENMLSAMKVHIAERGEDPRKFYLFAFGGAAPAHAYELARALHMQGVVVPAGAGVASATGLVVTPVSFDFARSLIARLDQVAWDHLTGVFDAMTHNGRLMLEQAGINPHDPEVRLVRSMDLRHVGQGHELTVEIPNDIYDQRSLSALIQHFYNRYAETYGDAHLDLPVELVTCRLTISGPPPKTSLVWVDNQVKNPTTACKGSRKVFFTEAGGFIDTPVFDRYRLSPGSRISGPAIVEERECTIVAGPSSLLRVDLQGNIFVDLVPHSVRQPPAVTGDAKEFDAISVEVHWNRLLSIMNEADATMVRTSFSTIVGESRDFGIIMLDRFGRSVAQSQLSSPAFVSHLPITTKHLLKLFPAEKLVAGDVLITNDPWLGTGHLPDLSIISPVFIGDELVAFIASAAHIADIGGRLDLFDARDLFEEGLRIPPSKLHLAGDENEQLFRVIAANVRVPHMVIGDIRAIVGAHRLAAKRLQEFLTDHHSAPDFQSLVDDILDRSERAMRRALEKLPDGNWHYELDADGFRQPVHLCITITKKADRIVVDFTGSSPQSPDAAINCVSNCTFADTYYPLKCSLAPEVPNNEGLFRPLNVFAPPGSILNATFPSAVKSRSKTSCHIHVGLYAAMAEVMPELVQAGSGDFWSVALHGTHPDGSVFNVHILPNGGKGATAKMDGLSTITFPYNGTVTPTEIVENQAPVLVEFKRFVTDSGGPGRFRGGLGQEIQLRARGAMLASIRPDKVMFPPPGIMGGRPGLAGRYTLNGQEIPVEPRGLLPGDYIYLRIPGGGGYGDPRDRTAEAVARDIARGYVSLKAARIDYGVLDLVEGTKSASVRLPASRDASHDS